MEFSVIQFTDGRYYVTKTGNVYSVKNLKYLRKSVNRSNELRVSFRSNYEYAHSWHYIYNILIANDFYTKENIPKNLHKAKLGQTVDDVNILTLKDFQIEREILSEILENENPNANLEKVKNRLKEIGGLK